MRVAHTSCPNRKIKIVLNNSTHRKTERIVTMPTGMMVPHTARVEALRTRHAALSHRIHQMQGTPSFSPEEIRSLKKQRLQLKDEIQSIN